MKKDPQATLDYAVDWTRWLSASETITASTWTVPTGLTQQASPAPFISGGTKCIVWLSGGTPGQVYAVTNHITTNQGREDERMLFIVVDDT